MSLYRFGTRNTGLIISPTQVASVVLGVDIVPAAFAVGQWGLTTIINGLRISVTDLPVDGGQPISALQYRLDGGAWVTMAGTGLGDRDVLGLSVVEYDVELRAVNSVGAGLPSDIKSETPTSAGITYIRFSTVPDFTETGSSGVGWTYTGNSANATASDPDYTLASGVAGGIVLQAGATGGALPKLGFATSPDGLFYADWVMEMVAAGGVWQWSSAGATLTTDVAQSYVSGDLLRFTFDATNGFAVEIARASAPTTWLPYRAGTHTRSATWYPKLVSDSAAGAVFTAPRVL